MKRIGVMYIFKLACIIALVIVTVFEVIPTLLRVFQSIHFHR